MMFDDQLLYDADQILKLCKKFDFKLSTAESCTGGLIISCLTEISGSSDVIDRGFITYSNEAKIELLGVPNLLIALHGAVSEEVAIAMSEGALSRSMSDITIAVTGVAGPGGGTEDKPVGLVHFACSGRGRTTQSLKQIFPGSRSAIRDATVQTAFTVIRKFLEDN